MLEQGLEWPSHLRLVNILLGVCATFCFSTRLSGCLHLLATVNTTLVNGGDRDLFGIRLSVLSGTHGSTRLHCHQPASPRFSVAGPAYIPGGSGEGKRWFTRPSPSCFFDVILSAPLGPLVSFGRKQLLSSPTLASPLITDPEKVVTNRVSPSGRVRPLQDQPVSTSSLPSLPLTGTHCRPRGAARTGHTTTVVNRTPYSGVWKGRCALAFCHFPDGSALLHLLHVC